MATFPSIAPIHSLNKTIAPDRNRTKLGDGYLDTHKFSLNTNKPEWQLEWLVDLADASTIDAFLRTQANGGSFFEWTSPDSSTLGAWRCNEWELEQLGPEVYRISAAFKQVFEIDITTLISVPAICQEEYCGFDYGNWEIITPADPPYINSTVSAPPALPCTGVSYQWYRNGVPISGATSSTYTLTGADNGQAITLGYDCPGDLPGGTGISAPVYPIPYPWENYDGTEIIFDAPGMFSVKFDVYSNFTLYECGTSTARAGEYVPLYRTEPGFAHPQVTGFKMVGPAIKNQTGICYSPSTGGGYAAGSPYVQIYGTWYLIISGYYGWTNDAGISWGPQGYSPEPRGIVQHLPVEMTFNGQPVYAPLPS